MESNVKAFIRTSLIILFTFAVLLILFSVAYVYASISMYNIILMVFIVTISICLLISTLMSVSIVLTYKLKKSGKFILALTRLGLRIIMPFVIIVLNTKTKKSIQNFYIEINNLLVESNNNKYKAEETMLLLPHCLQNSECSFKVTSNPKLCKRCGKCKIGALVEYAEHKHLNIFIVTGGTAARNIIKKVRPKLIISVACERDLMSGISDVRGIPVVGVTNMQPNGPCFNTEVDVEAISNRVEQLTI